MVLLVTFLASIVLGLQGPSPAVARLLSAAEQGDYTQAPIQRALALARRTNDRVGEGRSLFWLGRSYEDVDDPRAMPTYQQAVGVLRPRNDWVGLGLAWNRMGAMKGANGLAFLQLALDARRRSGNRFAVARTLSNLGSCYSQRGERQKAIATYWEAVHTAYSFPASRDPSESEEADTNAIDPLINLSDTYREDRNFKLARSCSAWALDLLLTGGNVDDWRIGPCLSNLGLAHLELGDYAGAEAQFRRALEFGTRHKDVDLEWKANLNLGVALHDQKRFAEAKGALEIALFLAPNNEDQPEILNNLGSCYEGLRDFPKALTLYRRAESIAKKFQPDLLPTIHLNLGWLALRQDDPRRAVPWFEQALREAILAVDPQAEARALHDLGLAWLRVGKRPLGIALMKQAITLHQRLRSSLVGLPPRLLDRYLDRIQLAYRDLANALIDDGRLPEAQQVLDLLKVAEADRFLRSGVVTATGVDLAPVEREWTEIYDKVRGSLQGLTASLEDLSIKAKYATVEEKKAIDAKIRSIDSTLKLATQGFETFIDRVRTAFDAVHARTNRLDVVKQSLEVQKLLQQMGGGVVAVYTLTTADAVRLILVQPNVAPLVTRGPAIPIAALHRKVMVLREATRTPMFDPRDAAGELYDLLIRPIEASLAEAGVNTILWSLDSTLRYIPINCLYDRATSKYAIEKYRSALFCWTSDVIPGSEGGRQWTGEALAVSKERTVQGVKFYQLSHALPEADAVSRWLGTDPVKDEEFTQARLEALLLTNPRVLHFATHFRFNPGSAKDSFLLLGDGTGFSVDSFRTSVRAGALNKTDLIVLSACETALSGNDSDESASRGSEFESFAQLVHEKGAATVVASLWPVDDASTSMLMGAFYRNLAERSMARMDALREAQLAVLGSTERTGPEGTRTDPTTRPPIDFKLQPFKGDPTHPYSHPFYWAPFVLIGNPR